MRFHARLSLYIFSLLLTACSNQHIPIDTGYVGSGKSATVVVVPPGKTLYRQIETSGARVSDIEFDGFQEGVIRSSANMLGYTAGYYGGLYAAGGPGAGAASATVPVVALAYVAAATTVGVAAKSYRFNRAEDSVEPHLQLLQRNDVTEFARQSVSNAVDSFTHLEVAEVTTAARVETECRLTQAQVFDFEDCIAGLDGDFAVVLAYFPQFTPNFEVLEVQAFVTVFDQSREPGSDPVYSNFILYQSKLYAGLFAEDTREDMGRLLKQRKQDMLDTALKNGRGSLDAYERMEIQERFERESAYFFRAYSDDLDKHDPEGNLWLADDGVHMLEALQLGLREMVRLAVYDINGGIYGESDTTEVLPGTARKMVPLEEVSTADRSVYRNSNGGLVSIDSRSRFILLEAK